MNICGSQPLRFGDCSEALSQQRANAPVEISLSTNCFLDFYQEDKSHIVYITVSISNTIKARITKAQRQKQPIKRNSQENLPFLPVVIPIPAELWRFSYREASFDFKVMQVQFNIVFYRYSYYLLLWVVWCHPKQI